MYVWYIYLLIYHTNQPNVGKYPTWWFQIFLYFHPDPWWNDPIWRVYFSDGLKPPNRCNSRSDNLCITKFQGQKNEIHSGSGSKRLFHQVTQFFLGRSIPEVEKLRRGMFFASYVRSICLALEMNISQIVLMETESCMGWYGEYPLGPLRSNSDNPDYTLIGDLELNLHWLSSCYWTGGASKLRWFFHHQHPKPTNLPRKTCLTSEIFTSKKPCQNLDLHRTIVFFSLQMVGPYIYQDLLLGMFFQNLQAKSQKTPLSWSNGWLFGSHFLKLWYRQIACFFKKNPSRWDLLLLLPRLVWSFCLSGVLHCQSFHCH